MAETKARSTPIKIKAKIGFHAVPDMELLKALIVAHDGLFNNSAFPNPPVDLVTFKTGIDTFSTLIIDAEDGGKKSISAKNKQRPIVIKMYTQLAHYVEAACNDDLAVFNTSGFAPVVKTTTAPQPLGPATINSIDRGANSGQVVVKVTTQTAAVAYDLRYALEANGGELGPWTMLTLTSPKKATLSGLTPAGTYQFQIRALGKLGYTDWSESMTFICA